MYRKIKQSGFSLIEMVVVIATILILAGALLGVGKYIKIRAEVDLTKSQLEVLATALEQYYTDFGKFPFDTDINGNGIMDEDYLVADLQADLTGTVAPPNAFDILDTAAPSSAALFYFLEKSPNSRSIAGALSNSLITNKDASDAAIMITIGVDTVDLPRFIDAWGTSIRYEYLDGTAFPILTSAGPDTKFATPDDVVNK